MKSLLLIIVLFFSSGCAAIEAPYHEFAWYQNGKSLAQTQRAFNECEHEAFKGFNQYNVFKSGMSLKGYRLVKRGWLDTNFITVQETPGVYSMIHSSATMHRDIAGE